MTENDSAATDDQPDTEPRKPRGGCRRLLIFAGILLAIAGVFVALNSGTPELSEEELARTRGLTLDQQPNDRDSATPRPIPDSVARIPADGDDSLDSSTADGESSTNAPAKKPDKKYIERPSSGVYADMFDTAPPESTDHPLDTALAVAQLGLRHIRDDIVDYTATLIKRERLGKKLGDEEFMLLKVRNEQKEEGKIVVPFAVYIKFLKPRKLAGRETIWIKGKNDNKLIGHGSGLTRLIKVNLDPTHRLAMAGNRYPISEIGIEMLAFRMLQKGRRDHKHGECTVKVDRNASIDDRLCTRIDITHPVERKHFEFHHAELYIDEEYNIPVRYAAWSWPKQPGGEKVLEEEYTYRDLKLNVGLTDIDFDTENPAYKFP